MNPVMAGRIRMGGNVRFLVRLVPFVCWVTCHGAVMPALAGELYNDNGLEIRWDNTLQYSTLIRLEPQAPSLVAPVNADDGDRNFAPGLASNRIDLITQADLAYGNFGAHASAHGWYDTVYHAGTDNNAAASYNPLGTPVSAFAPAARNLQGQYAELNDAFIFADFSVADVPVSLRAGRQTVTWGESLFYDSGSIAAAQAPVDIVKTYTGRSDYAADVFLPVTQIAFTAQPASAFSFSFYYQFDWRGTRQPADGSYFSTIDYTGAGANRYLLSSGRYLLRDKDKTPSGGQYGAAVHESLGEFYVGLYALHFDSKVPLYVAQFVSGSTPGEAGSYHLLYPKGIDLYGASFSGSAGTVNLAGEISLRRSAPLISYASPPNKSMAAPLNWVNDDDDVARGNTLDARLSATTTLSPAPLWDSADLSGEFVFDDVLNVTSYAKGVSPIMDRIVAHARLQFVPHYFQVLPNLDLSVPIGLGRDVLGHTASYAPYDSSNDFDIGIKAVYRGEWKAQVGYTAFLGGTDYQALADRDFLMASIAYSF